MLYSALIKNRKAYKTRLPPENSDIMPYTVPKRQEEIEEGRLEPGLELDDFLNWTNVGPGSKVLDAGVGWHGRHYKPLRDKGCYVCGLDKNKANLEEAKEELKKYGMPSNLVCGDMMQMPFREGTFDSVNSNALTPRHVQKWDDVMRVLKKGGKAYIKLILEASHPPGYEEHDYMFSAEDAKRMFEPYNADFKVSGLQTKLTEIDGTTIGQTIRELAIKIEKT